MSKKMNVTQEAAITATETTLETKALNLKDLFEQHPNASLRKLAHTADLSYPMILKKSKEPIPGEVYDPAKVNYDEVEVYLEQKGCDWMHLDWPAMDCPTERAKGPARIIENYKVGDKVYIRKDATTPFEIIYMTATHVVLLKEGTTEPIAWSNNTFLLNGPQDQPRAEKVEADAVEATATVEEVESEA